MKGQLAYDVSRDSAWGCEAKGQLDDAAKWQARSMIVCQGATRKIQKNLMALALGLILGFPGGARADFNFTTIDVPSAASTAANANSPNAIAGQYDDPSGATHGFILRGSAYTTIDVPKASFTAINGINAAGQLAGTYTDSSGGFHAFFSPSQGVFTTLTPLNSVRSQCGFLNAQGQVVGSYRTSDMKRHGFLWRGGTFKTFNVNGDQTPGGTVPNGINDSGQIVGSYVDADGNRHGFLLDKAPTCNLQPCAVTVATLDVPGALLTVAQGINNAGVIAGLYVDESGNQHGFVLSRGGYTTVDVAPTTFGTETTVFSINAQGEIVGSYEDSNGVTHGYVGTPAR
jgi:uncharacterized membrane protein